MRIIWLRRALESQREAIDYVSLENPEAALQQLDEIERQTDLLAEFPEMGRVGRIAGTRELVINKTPFILVYRVQVDLQTIEILRLLHGARKYP